MSDGCEGCSISQKGMQQQYSQIRKQAKDYAIEKNIPVAIYKERYQYFFIGAEIAIREGYPITEVVSPHN